MYSGRYSTEIIVGKKEYNGLWGLIVPIDCQDQQNKIIMKTKTTITELTHDDLVELFSTALYGSPYLGADYEEAVEYNEEECFEDIIANILLHDGSIKITDYYAEGCVYGSLPHEIDGGENVTYFVTYDDIKRGLEKAADGTFKSCDDKYKANELAFARTAYDAFVNYDDCGFDSVYADALVQIILFDEIIYG